MPVSKLFLLLLKQKGYNRKGKLTLLKTLSKAQNQPPSTLKRRIISLVSFALSLGIY